MIKQMACLLPLLLCSCSVQTYRHFVYQAQEGESVLIPGYDELRFYRAGAKTYIEGVRTATIPYTPAYASDVFGLNTPIREQHKPKPGAEQKTVYAQVEQRDEDGLTTWYLKDKQVNWLEKLPPGAYRLRTHSRLSIEDFFRGKTMPGQDVPTRPMEATASAWYHYPLAAASFVVVDVPATVAANGILLAASPFFLAGSAFECLSDFIYNIVKK